MFPTIHLEIWPMVFILSAILLWNVWFAWRIGCLVMRSVVRSAVVCAAVYVLLILPGPASGSLTTRTFWGWETSCLGGKHTASFWLSSSRVGPDPPERDRGRERRQHQEGSARRFASGHVSSKRMRGELLDSYRPFSRPDSRHANASPKEKPRLFWSAPVVMQVYLAVCIWAWIWERMARSRELALRRLETLSSSLNYTLVIQMGASFVVPVLVWMAAILAGEGGQIRCRGDVKVLIV